MIDFPELLSKSLRRTFWLFTYFFSKIGKYVNKSLKKYIFFSPLGNTTLTEHSGGIYGNKHSKAPARM